MFSGKTIFSQVIEFIHPQQFGRCVARYRGNYKVKAFSCWDQFLCMAFAQLTFRESLRDIEDCLAARSAQLYHLGFRSRVILAMLNRCVERYGHSLATHGSEEYQRRIARVAGVHHLPIVFVDPAIEQARQAARAAAPVPLSRAAQAYVAERNSKRERMTDIQPHRLWQTSDAGELEFVGFRAVENQNLLLTSNGSETLVLPISSQQRRTLAQYQRGTPLMISAELLIQPQIQGLEK